MIDTEKHPVVAGLTALVAVALAVGLLGGLGITMVAKAAGLGGGGSSDGSASSRETMYVPEPSDTSSDEPSGQQETEQEKPSKSATPEGINLTAGQSSVPPMGQIDLRGTYPQGEGAVLQVQRFEGGQWVDFPVTVSVSGQTFSTYVMTGRSGENRFRVEDNNTGQASNEVKVTVG